MLGGFKHVHSYPELCWGWGVRHVPDVGAAAAVVMCARLAELTDLPPEFVEDMRVKWGIHLEAAGSKVFDLFR